MLNPRKIIITTISSLGLLFISSISSAAQVSVGPYLMDNLNFASSLNSSSGSVGYYGTGSTSDITDADLRTFAYSTNGTGSINLGFSSNVGNGAGNDLALFFIGDPATVDITIGGVTDTLTSSVLTVNNDPTTKYMVDISGNFYDLSAILVDAGNFGVADDALISDVTVGLGQGQYLSLVGGFNTVSPTAVPLPAPLLLMLSGLTALGLFSRRKI